MDLNKLEESINKVWDDRSQISTKTVGEPRDAIEKVLEKVDSGDLRVAIKQENGLHFIRFWRIQ